jgi:glycosyltransferase involved in cell wall biosynthesis
MSYHADTTNHNPNERVSHENGGRVLVVIPCLNEESNVQRVWESIEEQSSQSGIGTDILFVDDGSSDDTWAEIVRIHHYSRDNPFLVKVLGVRFVQNLGKEVAQAAGILAASRSHYGTVALMDCDGQHRACDMIRVVGECRRRAEVVIGYRKDYERPVKTQVGVSCLRVLCFVAGVKYDPAESELIAIPKRSLALLAGDRRLGIFPITSILQSVFRSTVNVPITVKNSARVVGGSRFSGQALYRKAILHLLSDPWRILQRLITLLALTFVMLWLYVVVVAAVSIVRDEFGGLTSILLFVTLLNGISILVSVAMAGLVVTGVIERRPVSWSGSTREQVGDLPILKSDRLEEIL